MVKICEELHWIGRGGRITAEATTRRAQRGGAEGRSKQRRAEEEEEAVVATGKGVPKDALLEIKAI